MNHDDSASNRHPNPARGCTESINWNLKGARFQIECNFQDAKQHWGLEDFMTVKQTPVYNSANLAMFMVNVSHALIRSMRTYWPEMSVNDLNALFRSRKYVVETLKLLPEMPAPIFIAQAIDQMTQFGRVNHAVNPV